MAEPAIGGWLSRRRLGLLVWTGAALLMLPTMLPGHEGDVVFDPEASSVWQRQMLRIEARSARNHRRKQEVPLLGARH